MNNESPVCECGHKIHVGGCYEIDRGPDYVPCPCEQFTDARLAVLRAEIADLKQTLSDTQRFADLNLHNWMARLPQLEAEIARLTPTATRDVPTKEGWYWRKGWGGLQIVRVFIERGFWVYVAPGDDSEGIWRDDMVLWSKEPIPEMTIPEKGETE